MMTNLVVALNCTNNDGVTLPVHTFLKQPQRIDRLTFIQLGKQGIDSGVDFFAGYILVADDAVGVQDVNRRSLLNLPSRMNGTVDLAVVPPTAPSHLLVGHDLFEGFAIWVTIDANECKWFSG